ncbi:MAG: cysteine--tRNA ligase [Chthoniobacterales bacterium]
MAIRFHNTLSRKAEEFSPLDPEGRVVKVYTCGPTVYNFAHIGNFRAYIFEDLLQRHLEFRGYEVDRVMNLTDVDDKTIRGCRAAGVPLAEFTKTYKDAFFEDLKTLRIKPAQHFPAATEEIHIHKMIEMISALIKSGHAYEAEDHSVYFRIGSFAEYGKLAHLNLDELRPSGRVQNDEYEKESIGDFALWKTWNEEDGDVAWDSPWGRGRPGWHIECSAMATGILGPKIDIHCGGVDNIFPHHEAEIAQSECVTGETFSRFWLHCAHLMVEGRKMAKSEGNFFTLRDLIEKGWSGREVRYVLLSAHYRLPLNFTFEGLAAARSALQRVDEFLTRLTEHAASAATGEPLSEALPLEKFGDALDDDLNISAALATIFDTIREANRKLDENVFSPGQAKTLLDAFNRILSVLALEADTAEVPEEVLALVEKRKVARETKDWKLSDILREEILKLGWIAKDTKDGQKLTRAN